VRACPRSSRRTHPEAQQLAGRCVHRKGGGDPHDRLEDLMARLETLESCCRTRKSRNRTSLVPICPATKAPNSKWWARRLDADAGMLSWAREPRWAAGSCSTTAIARGGAIGLAGLRKQLTLFCPAGSRHLVPAESSGAFLQLDCLPAQDESLTVCATRSALAQARCGPGSAAELTRSRSAPFRWAPHEDKGLHVAALLFARRKLSE